MVTHLREIEYVPCYRPKLAVTLVQRGCLPHPGMLTVTLGEHMYDKETRAIRIQAAVAQ